MPVERILRPEERDAASGGDYALAGQRAWDTDPELIEARTRVRSHPAVLDACARVAALLRWSATDAPSPGPASDLSSPSTGSPLRMHGAASVSEIRLGRSEYERLHRATFSLLRPDASESVVQTSLDRDWAADSRRVPSNAVALEGRARVVAEVSAKREDAGFAPGADLAPGRAEDESGDGTSSVSFAQLCEGLLELADRWTASAEPGEAAEFLTRLAEAIAPRLRS